jgi:hypothetical protein
MNLAPILHYYNYMVLNINLPPSCKFENVSDDKQQLQFVWPYNACNWQCTHGNDIHSSMAHVLQ